MSRPSCVHLPITFVRHAQLSIQARVLYPLLISYADFKPKNNRYVGIRPGRRRLCNDLRCSATTLYEALDELQAARLLAKERHRTNRYSLAVLELDKFIQVPRDLLRCRTLRIPHKLLYMVVNTFDVWGSTGVGAYPSRCELERIMGCSESGLRGWVGQLVDFELLTIEDDGQYRLHEFIARRWAGDASLEVDYWGLPPSLQPARAQSTGFAPTLPR